MLVGGQERYLIGFPVTAKEWTEASPPNRTIHNSISADIPVSRNGIELPEPEQWLVTSHCEGKSKGERVRVTREKHPPIYLSVSARYDHELIVKVLEDAILEPE
jgi:hypothetical protein